MVRDRRGLYLRRRLPFLFGLYRAPRARTRRLASDARRSPQQRPRLRADSAMDHLRPSLRRHRRTRPAGRPGAGRAIRLPALDAMDRDRRGAGRMRAGFRNPGLLAQARRPLAGQDGSRRDRPGRRPGGARRRAVHHGHPDSGARPGRDQCDEGEHVGDFDRRRDRSDRDAGRGVHDLPASGPDRGSLGARRRAHPCGRAGRTLRRGV